VLWFVVRLLLFVGLLGAAIGWVLRGVWVARRRQQEEAAAKNCIRQHFSSDSVLARDRVTGKLYALCPAVVASSSQERGATYEATAVFAWRGGRWRTEQRKLLAHPPAETLARHRTSLEPIG
jgi:hypothetical protein